MLMQFFLIYFDELIGKDLGFWIYLQLFCYFGMNATPAAFPLTTLVTSIMVFGNLGEQLELTALKSAGIPFTKILKPLFIFICLLTVFVYFSNGYLVPKVNVKAYTLLYDLRKKKPSIAIKEGMFYNGIPDYSIRVERKLPDDKTLEDIIIYDHTKNKGNVHMTTAASGELTTTQDGQYLVIELFDGHNYIEEQPKRDKNKASITTNKLAIPGFYRIGFKSQKVLIDLDALKLKRTSEKSFTYHYATKTTQQIARKIAKMQQQIKDKRQELLLNFQTHYSLSTKDSNSYIPTEEQVADSTDLNLPKLSEGEDTAILDVDRIEPKKLSIIHDLDKNPNRRDIIQTALRDVRDLKYSIQSEANKMISTNKRLRDFQIEKYKRTTYAIGCIVMLLIGASLGALIKKGGLGIPLLISTLFILLYYMIDMLSTKWAKVGILDTITGSWAPNLILLPFALFFLKQAQRDTRIFEADAYIILWKKTMAYFRKKQSNNLNDD